MQVRRPPAPALLLSFAIVAGSAGTAGPVSTHESGASAPDTGVQRETPVPNPPLDRSGKKRVGKASVYAHEFVGRKMADGARMDARGDNAASKTLPLGTQAEVTNLKTGQSATVTIHDRGPYVKGRIVDLSPATADQIGLEPKEGVTKVEVKPITLPPPESGPKN